SPSPFNIYRGSCYSVDSRVALHWLNECSGRHFRETESSLKPIQARLNEPGVDLDGVKRMIERQCNRWKGTPQEEYLRPETLFGKQKFDSYYVAKDLPIQNELNTKPNPRNTGINLTAEKQGQQIVEELRQRANRDALAKQMDRPQVRTREDC
ncbi:MAG: conserved phage C-terminal domain-containing protein, partial [Patescibacteria group bacterium]|nr:conserved phage C-terminal domain-containing protein [Patescibacteria group bacterium]